MQLKMIKIEIWPTKSNEKELIEHKTVSHTATYWNSCACNCLSLTVRISFHSTSFQCATGSQQLPVFFWCCQRPTAQFTLHLSAEFRWNKCVVRQFRMRFKWKCLQICAIEMFDGFRNQSHLCLIDESKAFIFTYVSKPAFRSQQKKNLSNATSIGAVNRQVFVETIHSFKFYLAATKLQMFSRLC